MIKKLPRSERVEILILTQNRHNSLPLLLSSLLNQTFTNWDLTIIENDNIMSHLTNNYVIMSLLKEIFYRGHEVKVATGISSKKWEGLSLNFQKFIDETKNELIINCHDHNILYPRTLEFLLEPHFKMDNVGMTGGTIQRMASEPKIKENYNAFLDASETKSPIYFKNFWFKVQNGEWDDKSPDFIKAESLNGGLVSFRKSAIQDSGGVIYEKDGVYSIHEDTDTSLRVKMKGYDVIICTRCHHIEFDVKYLRGSFYSKYKGDPLEDVEMKKGHDLSNERFKNLYKQDSSLVEGKKIMLYA